MNNNYNTRPWAGEVVHRQITAGRDDRGHAAPVAGRKRDVLPRLAPYS